MFAIAIASIIPIRETPAHQSEMVSQILFGETIRIMEQSGGWLHVMLDFDGTKGWIEEKSCYRLNIEEYEKIINSPRTIFDSITELIVNNDIQPLRVIMGGEFYQNTEFPNKMQIGNQQFVIKQRINIPMRGNIRHSVINKALQYKYTPYLWGGRSINGIDCSAFTQMVFKQNGITLPREVEDQFAVGRIVNTHESIMPGELAFMCNENGVVCHVGIMIGENSLIHTDAWVRTSVVENGVVINDNNPSKYRIKYIKNIID